MMDQQQLKNALAWQIAIGADCALLDHPCGNDVPMPLSHWTKSQKLEAQISPPQKSGKIKTQPAASAPKPATKDAPTNLSHIETLEALKAALEQFEGCALKHTASNLVFADGNPDASVMLIGESPGRDEDRSGLPFVGAAGQLLDKMLKSIGLDRANTYICNILPWRPPGNRPPTPEETQMLWPFLRRHIQLKSPKIIMALGGSSAKLLLGETTGILKLRGRITECDFGLAAPVPVLPSLHPAYLLRSPGQKRLSYQDLLKLRQFLDNA